MIAIDTNLLVYAHRAGLPQHRAARRALERAAGLSAGWGFSHASLAEFWAVVTHPAASGRPSAGGEVSAFLQALIRDGDAHVWLPGPNFGERLIQLAADRSVRGSRVFDLQMALTALDNGAREVWTHDRDFVSVPGLRIHDPLA